MSFVPLEATDHTINITFNKDVVPGAPFVAKIHTGSSKIFNYFETAKPNAPLFSDPNRILVSGQSLAATAVGKKSSFTLSNVTGSAHDIDIVIDSPNGEAIPSEIVDSGNGNATKYRFLLSSLLLFSLVRQARSTSSSPRRRRASTRSTCPSPRSRSRGHRSRAKCTTWRPSK